MSVLNSLKSVVVLFLHKGFKTFPVCFLYRGTDIGSCLLTLGFILASEMTISWSAIPGNMLTLFTKVGLEVRKRSRTLPPLMGSLTSSSKEIKVFIVGGRTRPHWRHMIMVPGKGHIATLYCDVPTEKVIFKGERMHVRIWSKGPSISLVCICRLCFFTYMCFQRENCRWIHVLSATFNTESMEKCNTPLHFVI